MFSYKMLPELESLLTKLACITNSKCIAWNLLTILSWHQGGNFEKWPIHMKFSRPLYLMHVNGSKFDQTSGLITSKSYPPRPKVTCPGLAADCYFLLVIVGNFVFWKTWANRIIIVHRASSKITIQLRLNFSAC
jgi:hypothetical protein